MAEVLDLQRRGEVSFSVDGGDYFQIRIGSIEDPEVIMQEQIPDGKRWAGTVAMRFIETDL
jgi:hypothetical protein